jgi:hypothetical protein
MGACCRNPERFSAKDLNAISVQLINATSGAKAQIKSGIFTARLKPCPSPNFFALTLRAFQRA